MGVGAVSVCPCRDRVDTQCYVRCRLGFELGVQDSAADAELVLVVFRMPTVLTSGSCEKAETVCCD